MKKNILFIASSVILFTGMTVITSCGGAKKDQPKNETAPVSKDSTKATAYVCPMGPQCGKGETAGKCPNCGAEMVQNTKGLK